MRLQGYEEKVKLNTSWKDTLYLISEGNPGALRVLMDLMANEPLGFTDVLRFDTHGIYGQFIWIAYKDLCKENLDLLRNKIQIDVDKLIEEIKNTEDWKYYSK